MLRALLATILLVACHSGSPAPKEPASSRPAAGVEGAPCGDGCAEGLTCRTYYGIAGPKGPAFSSCERPCPCPDGEQCVTIADGPGQVCRPAKSEPAGQH